jgi:phage-related minor tail protein
MISNKVKEALENLANYINKIQPVMKDVGNMKELTKDDRIVIINFYLGVAESLVDLNKVLDK